MPKALSKSLNTLGNCQLPALRVLADHHEVALPFEGTPLLSDLLRENGFDLDMPCGGKGICGKCRVKAEGSFDPPAQGGFALACGTRVTGDAWVEVPAPRKMEQIEETGFLPSFTPNPLPGRYGLAVDIGTTTLAASLIALPCCELLASASQVNPQRALSDNVIGRVEAAMAGQGGRLQKLVADAIASLKQRVCAQAGIDWGEVDQTVITGNTAMLTLYAGGDTSPLSRAPFIAQSLFGSWIEDIHTYLPPCVGAFLGADLVCAVLASDMLSRRDTTLLADIGTNGELALWHQGTLYCCATAAGPAFEGGGVRDGTGSVAGAVDGVDAKNGEIAYTTIGGAPPCGICGSGLLDALAALLALDKLDETGALSEDEANIAPGVSITQKDVRSLQLAKAAIAAGINTLCDAVGILPSDVSAFYMAGGFGCHIRLESAAAIGLIPGVFLPRAMSVGNAALSGAMLHLMDKTAFDRAAEIARTARVVTLSGNPAFSAHFVDAMALEPF